MTGLAVDRSVAPPARPIEKWARLGGVGAEIPGLEGGAGFALFLSEGYLDALEGFAYIGFPNEEDRWRAVENFVVHEH